MSDDFHRPTLTFPSGAYNATQVRLYGIAPYKNSGIVYPGSEQMLKSQVGDYFVTVSVSTGEKQADEDLNGKYRAAIEALRAKDPYGNEREKKKSDIGKDEGPFKPDSKRDAIAFKAIAEGELDLPENFPLAYLTQVSIETKKLGNVAVSASISWQQAKKSQAIISCGIIVGYAFEGHTYDLPKPKIMIIPTLPEADIPKDDSGFDQKSPLYSVWLVDKLDECIEFEIGQGFVEQIVLDANLPGKRAPNMYAGRMMMGHRSGKLSE
jgi:hypothetical protein